ncbi:MAG: winged helix-turn-helix domain-containing protein [Alphaproteobacteria bacterium]|nr:winged helix-turn-helix domain-containing protein [Alphaproteobacteria bacterium]
MSIDPPDQNRPPKWTQALVNAANSRNRARGSSEIFSMADLAAAWEACGGRCAFSGLPFNLQLVGDGQAKRPFAPSLDRIDRHKPYQKDNVRLVVAVANFAMNAWGDEPVLQMASALHRKHGDRPLLAKKAPSDSDLENVAVIDTELVETDLGVLPFPPRADTRAAILELLGDGPQSSRSLEAALSDRFGITLPMQAAMLRNGCPAWRNHVAWALVDLSRHNRGTGQIERIANKVAPDGGSTGIYRLTSQSSVLPTRDAVSVSLGA